MAKNTSSIYIVKWKMLADKKLHAELQLSKTAALSFSV